MATTFDLCCRNVNNTTHSQVRKRGAVVVQEHVCPRSGLAESVCAAVGCSHSAAASGNIHNANVNRRTFVRGDEKRGGTKARERGKILKREKKKKVPTQKRNQERMNRTKQHEEELLDQPLFRRIYLYYKLKLGARKRGKRFSVRTSFFSSVISKVESTTSSAALRKSTCVPTGVLPLKRLYNSDHTLQTTTSRSSQQVSERQVNANFLHVAAQKGRSIVHVKAQQSLHSPSTALLKTHLHPPVVDEGAVVTIQVIDTIQVMDTIQFHRDCSTVTVNQRTHTSPGSNHGDVSVRVMWPIDSKSYQIFC
ncbi:hypothetical protein F2P81_016122 [Scophthalmus maximus]|uniref:Uncharacterized protein n=1 Tax=Scophthalmus maximus TaxID=52904 RepID=A0A6A4SEC3_SCOMX|nr:hypothetical protein F2P81_016122 [Scophthalmus maximus]